MKKPLPIGVENFEKIIEEKGYAKELEADGYKNIRRFGIAFRGKECLILTGDIHG
ncbi:MAG: PD-(D/E)XK nuclease domain-containing protein [Turicibacter sp.]|nr:PD-(D/E)XK nuclease domain-containing protein [Turicibacter sp.]